MSVNPGVARQGLIWAMMGPDLEPRWTRSLESSEVETSQ